MNKKVKVAVIILVIAILAVAGIFFAKKFLKSGGEEKDRLVYVESVGNITGNYAGLQNRYMGIVEAQETKKIEKDNEKKVKEIHVKVGDVVKKDDPLFTYDTDEMELDLQKMQLEYDNIENTINGFYNEINDLVKQRDLAPAEDNIIYTSQINNINAQLKESEYELSTKKLEIERQKESIESSTVFSPMDGVIKKINKDTSGNDNEYGYGYGYGGDQSDNSFITIMANGDFRVKGTISETNINMIMAGTPVIMRSRVDENIIWKGTISKIDYEPQQNENNEMYYGGGGESTTKYSFYVNIENSDGLLLGQHLYIELDMGQGEVKDGLYLPSYYIMIDGSDYYVWARDNDKKIEKRKIKVGELDEELDSYQILDGLTEKDYIAFPDDKIKEGNKTTTNYEDIIKQMGDDEDGDIMPEGNYDDYMMPEENYDGDMVPEGNYDGDMMPEGNYGDDLIPDGNGGYMLPEGEYQQMDDLNNMGETKDNLPTDGTVEE
ncbi:MAG: efflux RND transporter periplasmic adaptor subunit [Eubacterium sp.]|nr:efflux RND transporter periplasmic adaptor subunit [Eubacterium sp.]